MTGPRRVKIAIVGFTEHRNHAPFNHPDWEIWGLNDLYLDLPAVPNDRLRWFQVHDWVEPDVDPHPKSQLDFKDGPVHPRDANHVAWLRQAAEEFPLYMLHAREEVPAARILDHDAMVRYFGRNYFTNSISWMLGEAIRQLNPSGIPGDVPEDCEIGIWGVDMMMAGGEGSEYGYQRPSCEWLIGVAEGKGIPVYLPAESDLLKSAFVYGAKDGNAFRKKLTSMRTEMSRRRGMASQTLNEAQLAHAELTGAINTYDHIIRSWLPGDGIETRGRVPLPDAHKAIPAGRLQASDGAPITP